MNSGGHKCITNISGLNFFSAKPTKVLTENVKDNPLVTSNLLNGYKEMVKKLKEKINQNSLNEIHSKLKNKLIEISVIGDTLGDLTNAGIESYWTSRYVSHGWSNYEKRFEIKNGSRSLEKSMGI